MYPGKSKIIIRWIRQIFSRRRNRYNKKPWISPLTKRVLAVNSISLFILLAGLLYMDQYRKGLLQSEQDTLRVQAGIFADTLGELAVESMPDGQDGLLIQPARDVIRRIVPPTHTRARLFDPSGKLLIDSRMLGGRKGRSNSLVQVKEIAAAPTRKSLSPTGYIGNLLDDFGMQTSWSWHKLEQYAESAEQSAQDYPEVLEALDGVTQSRIRRFDSESDSDLMITVAVPVKHYRHVLGALMVSKTSEDIEKIMGEVWSAILKVFALTLAVTLLLSAYLARTLSRPIVRLADAANRMRVSKNRNIAIPDLSARQDEIGDLSMAMRDLTEALWNRLDAIERFAADVAHEIKNPLNSLRSAVETVVRLQDTQKQKQLLQIIFDDVQRLDRLITDISEASRVDSDISKAHTKIIDVVELLAPLVQAYGEQNRQNNIRVDLFVDPTLRFNVLGISGRIIQVLRNLLDNSISFSPPDGAVGVHIKNHGGMIEISVTDQGGGIHPNKLDKIFERFYTDRPNAEKFGQHSGLGLSISRQIIEAMGGKLMAENIHDSAGKPIGAEFRIFLPSA